MAITDEYQRIPCTQIVVKREERQRKDLKITEEFKDSIKARGVLLPIIVTRDLVLVAGERRLTASLELGLETIPCRFFEDLDPAEAQIVELEENVKRQDLSWQEIVLTVKNLYALYTSREGEISHGAFAARLNLTRSWVSSLLRVGEDIDNPRIAAMPTVNTALNTLRRADERRAGDAISAIVAAAPDAFDKVPKGAPPAPGTAPEPTAPPAPPPEPLSPIMHTSFAEWLTTYQGERFNFLHCDFPYGVNLFDGQYGAASGDKHYEDTPEIYFQLIDLLAANLDRVLGYSAHVMFWFSMEHYEETLSRFRTRMPDIVWNKFPLIWAKSDNVGIMPDPKRGPRRVYETCLMGSRGDRPVVKPIANYYACPTDKQFHPSTKPVPMLKHFFQMFVDNSTRLLDPTCGSGSALRAALDCGAPYVLGLEQDEEHYKNAVRAYTHWKNMRKIANA